jgi:dihydroorotase
VTYDLLVKHGFLVDPIQGIEDIRDIAISNGKVMLVSSQISGSAKEVIDAAGMVVTPGLIDIHAHVYRDASDSGANADVHCLLKGVTTVVDGGSSGSMNFLGLRRFIMDASQTRILCFLSACKLGVELGDLRHLDFSTAVQVAKENKDVIMGIKLRLGERRTGVFSSHYLRLAKEVARAARVPLMIHIFGPDPLPDSLPFLEVLKVLEGGDIITHSFHPPPPSLHSPSSILDRSDGLLSEVMEARKRGILFDVGHGRYQFSWDTAEKAIRQGFLPDTISSDLTKYSVGTIVYDLPTVLSKFLHLGLSLSEVIKRSTINPAAVLGLSGSIGTLKPGAEGDVAIFRLDEGKQALWDNLTSIREQRTINKLLVPVKVIKAGRVVR